MGHVVKMRLLMSMAFCAAMLAGATAAAQVSLSAAVDLALRNDPRMKMAQADVLKARAQVSENHDAFVPNTTAGGGYGTSTGVPLSVPVLFSISAQSLIFNFSQKDNVRAAEAGLTAAELALQETRNQIAEDVIVTYLNLNHTQQRAAALGEEYGFAAKLTTIVQERLDAGDDTNMEFLKAKRTAAQIHYQQLLAQDDVANLSDHLSRMIGLPGNQLTTVPDSIPQLPAATALTANPGDDFGVRAAFATARSKQEFAFGMARYRMRPQIGFGANYSRIYTNHTNYATYYPAFASANHLSYNDLSVGIHVDIPLFDMGHEARAREAAADAARARFEAQNQQNTFLEGRAKLRHSLEELELQADIAEANRGIAQEELNAVLSQLTADNAATGRTPMSPKDEQNARMNERARYLDLLDADYGRQQATVNLMRQTGQLDSWLSSDLHTPATLPAVRIPH